MEFNPQKQKTQVIKKETPEAFEFNGKKPEFKIEKAPPKAEMTPTSRPLEPEQQFCEFETDVEIGKVRAWSFSSIKRFEQCPAATKYQKIDKIKEPDNKAMERGTAIHKEAEDYIQGITDELPKSLSKFPDYYQWMRDEFAAGRAIVEEDWAHRIDWSECGWSDRDAWYRAKLDVMVFENKTSAIIIDHKSGKKYGNETKHQEQGLLYAITAFLRYPELELIKYVFVYVDHGVKLERTLTREQALRFHALWHRRGLIMTTATMFDYMPSAHNCRWCFYGKEGICPNAWNDEG